MASPRSFALRQLRRAQQRRAWLAGYGPPRVVVEYLLARRAIRRVMNRTPPSPQRGYESEARQRLAAALFDDGRLL